MLNSAYPMLKLICRWLLACGVAMLATLPVAGQDFSSAANQLAVQVSQQVAPGSASLSIQNRSSLNDEAVSLVRDDLWHGFELRGWKIRKPEESEISIAITLAESYRKYVWTAEIVKAGSREVSIVELAKSSVGGGPASDRVAVSRALLVSSDTTLLDVTELEGKIAEGARLLALTPTTVQLFALQSGQWRLIQSQPLSHPLRPNRDLRGRIAPYRDSSFDAYLPAVHCTGGVASTLTVMCHDSDDPWPLDDDRQLLAFYASNRNYFNGVLSAANRQSDTFKPFFSAAILGDRSVYSNLDGHPSMVLPSRQPIAVSESWGSEIAGIQSSCRSDLVLASSAGDFQQTDAITAFRLSNSEFRAVSEPISFAGAVVSLKTAADRQQAIAVVATPSGRYEAYLLTARCGA